MERLRRDLGAAREALGHARARLAASAADELVAKAQATGSRFVVALLEADVELLRAVAKRITEAPEWVAMLAAIDGDGHAVIVTRGSTSPFDCGAFLKRAAVAGKGRGGGRPERAEGRMPRDVDWPNLCQRLLASSVG
jgi:alanyl-tRNA synthetase